MKKHYNVGQNNSNYINGKSLKLNFCIDCHKKISWNAKRCKQHGYKHNSLLRIGKKASNYKHGESCKNKKHYCIECNKLLIDYTADFCKYCSQKGRRSPKYKNGYYSKYEHKNNHCIDCNKIIYPISKRCKKCNYNFLKKRNKLKQKKNRLCCIICGKLISRYDSLFCRKCYRGKNHSNWLGGIGYEIYPPYFNNKIKEQIRSRDDYKCQKCCKKENNRKLDIHHIDYNKKNCEKDNLITLCHKCNNRANYNRDYWYAYFKYIIKKI